MADERKEKHSVAKELDVCHDCAEYGGHFCDECLEEIKKLKEKNSDMANDTND